MFVLCLWEGWTDGAAGVTIVRRKLAQSAEWRAWSEGLFRRPIERIVVSDCVYLLGKSKLLTSSSSDRSAAGIASTGEVAISNSCEDY